MKSLRLKEKQRKQSQKKWLCEKKSAKYTAGLQKKSRDAKKTKSTGTKSVMSDAQKKGQAGTRQTKKDFGPKGKGTPKTVGVKKVRFNVFL